MIQADYAMRNIERYRLAHENMGFWRKQLLYFNRYVLVFKMYLVKAYLSLTGKAMDEL